MKKFFLPALIALCLNTAVAQKLVTVKVAEGIKVKLPKDFAPMSDDDLAIKYPSSKKPLFAYTSPDRLVDFNVNVSKSKLPGNDLNIMKGFYKATILNLYEKVEFLNEGVKTIADRQFIIFEYNSKFEEKKYYNYIMYTLVDDQVFIFNFACPLLRKQQWQPVAGRMMESVKVTAKKAIEVKTIKKEGVKKYEPRKPVLKSNQSSRTVSPAKK